MKVQRLAAHPLVVAVAMGLLAPTSLADLAVERAPNEVKLDPSDDEDGLDPYVADLLDELRAD